MKRMIVFLCAIAMVLGATIPASAALVTITFDEPGISAYIEGVTGTHLTGPLNDIPVYNQGDGDLITDQYAALGVNWIVDPDTLQPHNEVTQGEMFNNEFEVTDNTELGDGNQILWYNGNPVEGNIQLDFLADSLAFDYRKPGASDPVQFKLFNGLDEVYDSGILTAIGAWQTFTYNAIDSDDYFDRIVMSGPKKYVIDNLEINAVPIPSGLLLLGSGLIPVVIRRSRKQSVS